MVGIVANLDGIVEEVGGIEDHVHLLLFMPPKLAPADAIRTLKANSSKWVHDTWSDRAAVGWQRGYGLFTVSESVVPAVKHYIQNQAEHHRQISFQDEFRRLLEKHGIAYDENDLWD
jgi:REP element-mobilizing transposase RayT